MSPMSPMSSMSPMSPMKQDPEKTWEPSLLPPEILERWA